MQKLWGKKVSDTGHATFVSIFKYVALTKGKDIGFVNRFYPSSKTCHICKAVNHELTFKDRTWTCVCGVTHDRDINAAINIHMEGASSIGLGDVRPVFKKAISA